MKKIIFLSAIILLPFIIKAQNLPACDSLIINCCTFTSGNPNTITIQVSNYSSVLFDYPGFALFDLNMDTVAIETVSYFGISTGPQPHTMEIIAPLTLPFNGYLNLYTLFYDTLACSFPFTIPDTITAISYAANSDGIKIYSQPLSDRIIIEMNGKNYSNTELVIFNVFGESVLRKLLSDRITEINVKNFSDGIYFYRLIKNRQVISASKIIIR